MLVEDMYQGTTSVVRAGFSLRDQFKKEPLSLLPQAGAQLPFLERSDFKRIQSAPLRHYV